MHDQNHRESICKEHIVWQYSHDWHGLFIRFHETTTSYLTPGLDQETNDEHLSSIVGGWDPATGDRWFAHHRGLLACWSSCQNFIREKVLFSDIVLVIASSVMQHCLVAGTCWNYDWLFCYDYTNVVIDIPINTTDIPKTGVMSVDGAIARWRCDCIENSRMERRPCTGPVALRSPRAMVKSQVSWRFALLRTLKPHCFKETHNDDP